jgi:hypothetical protein
MSLKNGDGEKHIRILASMLHLREDFKIVKESAD